MGERYYLRILLQIVRGAICYEDLSSVNGTLHSTFKETCLARGLLDDTNEWDEALTEVSAWVTGAEVRGMFCSMLMFSEVGQPDQLWEAHWEDLTDDLPRRLQREQRNSQLEISIKQRRNLGLYELELILNKNGRSLRDYPPIPLPSSRMLQQTGNRLIREQLVYDISIENDNLDLYLRTLNQDQM